jgi:hypothetical protein
MAFSARLLTLLLGATLAVSACGAQQAGAAAIVDGKSISDQDVQTASLQLDTFAPGQQQFTPSMVLRNLILEPYVLAEANRTGKVISDAQARQAIAKVANPSPSTITYVKTALAIQTLSPASKTSILAKLGKAQITVNPRYGAFDVTRGEVLATSPNWIKASTSSGAK